MKPKKKKNPENSIAIENKKYHRSKQFINNKPRINKQVNYILIAIATNRKNINIIQDAIGIDSMQQIKPKKIKAKHESTGT